MFKPKRLIVAMALVFCLMVPCASFADYEQVYGEKNTQDNMTELLVWSWGDGEDTTIPTGKRLKIFDVSLGSRDSGSGYITFKDSADKIIYHAKVPLTYGFQQLRFKPPVILDAGGYVEILFSGTVHDLRTVARGRLIDYTPPQ